MSESRPGNNPAILQIPRKWLILISALSIGFGGGIMVIQTFWLPLFAAYVFTGVIFLQTGLIILWGILQRREERMQHIIASLSTSELIRMGIIGLLVTGVGILMLSSHFSNYFAQVAFYLAPLTAFICLFVPYVAYYTLRTLKVQARKSSEHDSA